MTAIQPDLEYQRFLAEGRFMLQRCRTSGRYLFYPRVAEPKSGSADLEWLPASGRGTVYSSTVVRQRSPVPDYNVALIELEEGPRMMSRVVGIAPDAVKIGIPVQARIIIEAGQPLVVFEPAAQVE